MTGSYCTSLKKAVENAFDISVNNQHTDVDDSMSVQALAFELSKFSISKQTSTAGRKSFLSDNIVEIGYQKLAGSGSYE